MDNSIKIIINKLVFKIVFKTPTKLITTKRKNNKTYEI